MERNFGRYYFTSDATDFSRAASRAAVRTLVKSGENLIDGVLHGTAWSSSSTLTYAFPTSSYSYGYTGEPDHQFGAVGTNIRNAAKFALDTSYGSSANNGFAVEGFTRLAISPGSNSTAVLRFAESTGDGDSYYNDTAVGYLPEKSEWGGDVWFGPKGGYNAAHQGNYEFTTVLHETGHALGLKHGHTYDSDDRIKVKLAARYDSLEYSVMTYHGFKGADLSGYTNEDWGYPQTYMMADIAALQYMYGADYETNAGKTVYKWLPTTGSTYANGEIALKPGANRIFATIWDGGGSHDTYDLSAYSTRVEIDLRPGHYSVFKTTQRAELDYDSGALASGNIYNALLYKNNKASLIEDAIGGSGNDKITGNTGNNHLKGNAGNDTLVGLAGNDTYYGGGGKDTFYFMKNYDADKIADFKSGDKINLQSFDLSNFSELRSHVKDSGANIVFDFGSGDSLMLIGYHKDDLSSSFFTL